ncbi:MAG TPA: cytochrome P450 [Polyangiaceae bacterium]|nr:cytochrome P450 [Polyangiaceae bacterium]
MTDLENWFADVGAKLTGWLGSPEVLRVVTKGLRRCAPTIVLHGRAFVTLRQDVLEVLSNDRDFGVTEVYDAKMRRTSGAFVLGMENTPQYRREAAFIRAAVHAEDMSAIRASVGAHADELVTRAQPQGKIDAVEGFSHLIPLRLLRDYFGTPGPDWATLARWMRSIFWEIFLNFTDDVEVAQEAERSSAELRSYLENLVAQRKRELSEGQLKTDDFVSRLVKQQQLAGARFEDGTPIDDATLVRNIGGVIVGAVDTQSKAITHALEQLIEHPGALRAAQQAALDGDRELVAAYVWEALRFNPHNPILIRFCRNGAVIGAGTEREVVIPSGTTVFVSTLSAMFDESVLDEPEVFRPGRPREHYLHFGHGQHRCFGEHINRVVLPEVIQRVLVLRKLRVQPGEHVEYVGPFPKRFALEFDPS